MRVNHLYLSLVNTWHLKRTIIKWKQQKETMAALDKGLSFYLGVTAQSALQKAFEHQTHHRGQAAVYIRMQGVSPPSMKLF